MKSPQNKIATWRIFFFFVQFYLNHVPPVSILLFCLAQSKETKMTRHGVVCWFFFCPPHFFFLKFSLLPRQHGSHFFFVLTLLNISGLFFFSIFSPTLVTSNWISVTKKRIFEFRAFFFNWKKSSGSSLKFFFDKLNSCVLFFSIYFEFFHSNRPAIFFL